MTTYASDTFNRPDAGTLGTADVGGVWTSGPCFLSGNKARANAAGFGTLPTGQANGTITVSLNAVDPAGSGIVFRVSDANNYWFAMLYSGRVYIGKVVAGSMSFPADAAATFVSGSNIQVILNGTAIEARVSTTAGGTPIALTGMSITDAFNQTATAQGLYAFSSGDFYWDNLTFVSIASVADHLTVTTEPSSSTVTGAAHATQPVVAVKDSGGTTDPTDTSTVTAALVVTSGSGTALGTLTKVAVAGVADFAANGLGVTSAAGCTAHWHFTDGSLTATDSASFTITASSGTGMTAADNTLVAAMGGDAHVSLYSARGGVTAIGGGQVDTITDLRGGSYSPSLAGGTASGSKPLYDAAAKTVEINQSGSQNWLATLADPKFDPSSAKTIVHISTFEPLQNEVVSFQNTAADKVAGIFSGYDPILGISVVKEQHTGGQTRFAVSPHATNRQLVQVSYPTVLAGGIGTNNTIAQCAGRVAANSGTPGLVAGSWRLVIGGTTSAATAPRYSHQVWRETLIVDHQLSAAEWSAVVTWAVAVSSPVIDATRKTLDVEGNSIMAGVGSTGVGNDAVSQTMSAFPTWEYSNHALSGQDGTTIQNNLDKRSLISYHASHPKNVVVLGGEGTNEIRSLGHDPSNSTYPVPSDQSTFILRIINEAAAVRARGSQVLWVSILPFGGATAAMETCRLGINSYFRANHATYFDAYADVASITVLGNTADTTYYADTIHPTNAGHLQMATDATYGMRAALAVLDGGGGGGAGVADHLQVMTQPAGFAAGSSCTTPAVVAVKDSLGNLVTGFSGTISVTGGALTGPTTLPVFNGLATFRRLACTTPGSLTLAFTSAGLTGVSATATTVLAATGTFYKGAELPRSTPSLPAWMAQQASGAADVTTVMASAAALQAAIYADAARNAAGGGALNRDYLIPDGATWLSNIEWAGRPADATGWMRVRCQSDIATATGTQTSAALNLGKGILETASTAALFQTVSPPAGAQALIPHHYAIAGLTLRSQPGLVNGFWLIGMGTGTNQDTLAKVPHHFVLDRNVIDGGGSDITHAVFDSIGWHVIRDNAVVNIHSQSSDGGHAFSLGNGDGPALIENNTLQCSGVIVILGGSDPNVAELIPSDITIRGNLLTRNPLWNRNLYPATGWLTKNNLDLKNCQRVLFEGNVLENSWVDGQGGSLTNIKSVNQGGSAPWCGSSDIVMRNNFLRNAVEAYSLAGRPEGYKECAPLSRYVIENSAVVNIPSHVRIGGGGTFDGVIDHCTWRGGAAATGWTAYIGDDADVQVRFTLTNVAADIGQNQGVVGQTTFPPVVFSQRAPGGVVTKNVIANPQAGYSQANANFPAGNFIDGVATASIGFTSIDETSWDVLAPATVIGRLRLLASSPYHLQATDSTDIGADITALLAALAGTVAVVTPDAVLTFTRQPVGGVSGGVLSVQPRVESRLAGVTDATDTRHVTLSLITLSGGPGVLSGTTSGFLVAGVFDPGNIHVAGAGVYEIGVDFA